MLFADDCILFSRASRRACRTILKTLGDSNKASGQAINFYKSSISFSKNVERRKRRKISEFIGIKRRRPSEKDLGIPVIQGRPNQETFEELLNRIQTKLQGWRSKLLSKAGKLTLIKSVTSAIPHYSMSCFLLPKSTRYCIDRANRQFIWSNNPPLPP